jgi:hypothetical protein
LRGDIFADSQPQVPISRDVPAGPVVLEIPRMRQQTDRSDGENRPLAANSPAHECYVSRAGNPAHTTLRNWFDAIGRTRKPRGRRSSPRRKFTSTPV